MKLRIGAVSYLNTKPLIHGLEQRLPEAELLLDLPSRLADRLAADDLDIALIPSVEYLQGRDWSIVSNACIASQGRVRSVRMLFRCPPSEVQTLSLDEGSRTSAVLAQTLLAHRHGVTPVVRPLGITDDFLADEADATVIIGDRAMSLDQSSFLEVWDLGEQWQIETDLPFVFAMWVTRHHSLPRYIAAALADCRDQGMQELGQIIECQAPLYGLTEADCRKYFTEQLYFYLGQRELGGLSRFSQLASDLNLIANNNSQLDFQSI